ncbi:hypothetical protein M408DRAFT_283710 [Serendipita vermifera MAFF 305830]|uniref:Uncharacterized protein n=1 Tax=Serendipita vermifera MAFF 305830 TaxID=933852 RepID=A0A0C3ACY3_SERVB|nr:hypothetical protein M408DRAFT_283710 [Serendipita vermifera MAFF 305830]
MTSMVVPEVPPWYFDYFVFTPSSAPITSGLPDSRSSTTNTAVSGNTSPPPTGAIVGGVVGGVVILSLVLFALFWRRRCQQQFGPRQLREKGEIDGSPTKVFASQSIPDSELNDDSREGRARARPADDLAYKTAPSPMKGRFSFARGENAANRAARRQTMVSSSAGDGLLSPSVISSSVPGISQSEEPDESGVSESPAQAPSLPRQRQSKTLGVQQEAAKDFTPFLSRRDCSTTTAMASTVPIPGRPNMSLMPVREIDAGI